MAQSIFTPSLLALALGLAACNGDYSGTSKAEQPSNTEQQPPLGTVTLGSGEGSQPLVFDASVKSYSLSGVVLKAGEAQAVPIQLASGKYCAFSGELTVELPVALNCNADAASGQIKAVKAGSYQLVLNASDLSNPSLKLVLVQEDTSAPFGVVVVAVGDSSPSNFTYDTGSKQYVTDDLLLAKTDTQAKIRNGEGKYCALDAELEDGKDLSVHWQLAEVDSALKVATNGAYALQIDAADSVNAKIRLKLLEANQPPVAQWQEVPPTEPAPRKGAWDASSSTDANAWDQGKLVAHWDFGDGTVINDKKLTDIVTHTYQPGSYQLKLTVVDTFGESSTKTVDLTYKSAAPVANFVFSPDSAQEAPATVSFDASSSSDDVEVTAYSWEFGDGQTATGAKVSHLYTNAGSYQATLTVTDADAQTHSQTQIISVQNPTDNLPVASFSFSPAGGTAPISIDFDASASTDDKGIQSYQWNFGDGSAIASGVKASHQYVAGGSFEVTLTVTDTANQTHFQKKTLTITAANKAPVASFKALPASVKLKQDVVFESTSTDSDGTIVKYDWLIDGMAESGSKVTKSFSKKGTVKAKLTVTDDKGATHTSAEQSFEVINQAPVAKFSFSPAAPKTGEQVTFVSESTDSDGSISQYQWSGNGQSGAAASFSTTFASAGSFDVTLKVTDDQGDSHSTTSKVSVTAASNGNAANGKLVFERVTGGLGCVSSGCHAPSPGANTNKIMNGVTLAAVEKAFSSGTSALFMAGFRSQYSVQDLEDVAAYIATFK